MASDTNIVYPIDTFIDSSECSVAIAIIIATIR